MIAPRHFCRAAVAEKPEPRETQLLNQLRNLRKFAVEARPNFQIFFEPEDIQALDNFRVWNDSLIYRLEHRNEHHGG